MYVPSKCMGKNLGNRICRLHIVIIETLDDYKVNVFTLEDTRGKNLGPPIRDASKPIRVVKDNPKIFYLSTLIGFKSKYTVPNCLSLSTLYN